jgi:hypothetical protein
MARPYQVGHSRSPLFLIEPKKKKNMEALVFALTAIRNGYNYQEAIVPEPPELQPFNLRALKTGNRPLCHPPYFRQASCVYLTM